jgi:hypothetical protein
MHLPQPLHVDKNKEEKLAGRFQRALQQNIRCMLYQTILRQKFTCASPSIFNLLDFERSLSVLRALIKACE